MSLHVRNEGDVVILDPTGMLLGGKETDELREKITELDSQGNQKLLINLDKVSFMSSMGLSTMFLAQAKYAKRGAVVKLCGADTRIQHIFVIVRLTLVYGDNLCDTEEQALRDFRQVPAPAESS